MIAIIQKDAVLSPCQKYQFVLSRIWDVDVPKILFIGLNPSTADASKDDPTICRLVGFAQRWGFGGIYVMNLFAYRATDPKELRKLGRQAIAPLTDMTDTIHTNLNDYTLMEMAKDAATVVFCWGSDGKYLDRAKEVKNLFPEPFCFGRTKSGQPKHPLYIKSDTLLEPYL